MPVAHTRRRLDGRARLRARAQDRRWFPPFRVARM